ncbi:MAG: tetratricopeptide repeat protein [Sedimentisphaerales bacterium]|nr:tetratricopeptide repeat protein [Sedimentisphaerales bacterium]
MARKKLNVKVAVLGLMLVVILAGSAGLYVWERYGPVNVQESLDNATEAIARGDYKAAEKAFSKAYRGAKGTDTQTSDQQRIEILFTACQNLFLLDHRDVPKEDPLYHEPAWDRAIANWRLILTLDPKNLEAHRRIVEFVYESADTGNPNVWGVVRDEAQAWLKVFEDLGQEPELFAWIALGRSKLEMVRLGQETQREKILDEAKELLEQARQLQPGNPELYKYLADIEIIKGRIEQGRGIVEAEQKGYQRADEILSHAVSLTPDSVEANINLLQTRLNLAMLNGESIEPFQTEFEAIVERFSTSPDADQAFFALSQYYQGRNKLAEAIEMIEKAISLKPQDVRLAIHAAQLYYRNRAVNRKEEDFERAVKLVSEALHYPDAQETTGPRQAANLNHRYQLYSLQAQWYVDLALKAKSVQEKQDYITRFKDAKHKIEQIHMSAEDNPIVGKWRGMEALIEGDRIEAMRLLYSTHQQLSAIERTDPFLAYALAGICDDQDKLGVRVELLHDAIFSNSAYSMALLEPQVLLDYAKARLEIRQTQIALGAIREYDRLYGQTPQSIALKARVYIEGGLYEEAKIEMDKLPPDDLLRMEAELALVQGKITRKNQEIAQLELGGSQPDTAEKMKTLREEMAQFQPELARRLEELLHRDPSRVNFEMMIVVCDWYVSQNDVAGARRLCDTYLAQCPDNERIGMAIYRQILEEPDPANVSPQRRSEIAMQAVRDKIPDSPEQSIALAELAGQDYEKAASYYQNAISAAKDDKQKLQAVQAYFNLALANKEYDTAARLVEQVKTDNLDQSNGQFFAARLVQVQGQLEEALRRINSVLDRRPLFAQAYTVRSQIRWDLQQPAEAIKDISEASRIAPLNPGIARQKATILFDRFQQSSGPADSERAEELGRALAHAMMLNPKDIGLVSLYAEYIKDYKPNQALAIRQQLFRGYPSVNHAALLSDLAFRMAQKETDAQQQKAFYDICETTLKQALTIEPNNSAVLHRYAEYLRVTGQQQVAEQIFQNSPMVLWQSYLRDSQYEKARQILMELYQKSPTDPALLRGLIAVAVGQNDNEALRQYLGELLSVENTPQNELLQIQMFLDKGLDREQTKKRLASYLDRYPDDPLGMLLEAWLSMAEGRLEEAMQLTNRVLEGEPENPMARRLRGQLFRLQNDLPRAIEDLRKALNAQPHPQIRVELAVVYQQQGKYDAAIAELTEAIKDPQAPPRARTMLEELYARTRNEKALVEFYNETLKKYPDDPQWLMQAGTFALRHKNYEQAKALLKKAWDLSPQTYEHAAKLDLYLESLVQNGEYDQLLKIASEYTDEEAFAALAYSQIAQAQKKKGSGIEAVNYYYRALEKCGTNDRLMLGVLRNMLQMVGPEEVEKWCQKQMDANPSSVPTQLMMFTLTREGGQYNRALTYIDKCMELVGSDKPIWIRFAMDKANVLILAYAKTADRRYLMDGIGVLEQILEIQPDNSTVLNNLAYLLADNNERLDEAVEFAGRAFAVRPENPTVMDTYAYTLAKAGKHEEAVQKAQMAIQYYEYAGRGAPWDVYKHLGLAQEGLGKKKDALAAYQQALAIPGEALPEPEAVWLKEAIQRMSN